MFKNTTRNFSQSKTLNVFLGLTFIIFGSLFLLSNYGVIPKVEWDKIWPLMLVILGVVFVIKAYFSSEIPPQGFGL